MPGVSADWLLGLRDSAALREIKTGTNSAVAIGNNIRQTVRGNLSEPGALAICSKCPHLKKLKKFEALLKKI